MVRSADFGSDPSGSTGVKAYARHNPPAVVSALVGAAAAAFALLGARDSKVTRGKALGLVLGGSAVGHLAGRYAQRHTWPDWKVTEYLLDAESFSERQDGD